jgi:hypothetical protein
VAAVSAAAAFAVPLDGSRLVFDTHTTGTWPNARADVELMDVATDTLPTKLATQVGSDWAIGADNKSVVWVNPGDALYIHPLP